VLLFFPVPPSLRQAAGPLKEDLPNVFAGNLLVCEVDLTLERPSPRGIQRRLLLREFSPALLVNRVLKDSIE
jgi:hypothetical protein